MEINSSGLGFRPPHPGEVIKQDILPNTGLNVGQLAAHLGVGRATLSELLNEKRHISQEMAIRLGKAFRNGTRFWLALQMQHDLWELDQKKTYQIDVEPLNFSKGSAA